MVKQMKFLDNYTFFERFSRTHGETMTYADGEVYGDERFPNGSQITTTAIVDSVADDGDLIIVTSSGSYYRLGNKLN